MTDILADTASPVFVVGAPRSGTTMLAAMLGSHPALAAGPETQFFNKIGEAELAAAVADPHWPDMATALIARLDLVKQPVIALFGLTEAGVRDFLAAREPSVQAMLEALCLQFAQARGKRRWVEKTPNHLRFAPQLRSAYPLAPIVRIVRDPRDSALSTRKLPSFSPSTIANAYLWREWYDSAHAFFATDPLSLTIRYEDLVADAAAVLERICEFAGEPFDPAMLDFARAAPGVSSRAETWKKPVSGGLTTDRLYAWKKTLKEDERRVCDLVCAEYLEDFGYECRYQPEATRYAYRLSRGYIERFESVLKADAANGLRWLPTDDPAGADKVVNPPRARGMARLRLVRDLGRDALRIGPAGVLRGLRR